MKAACRMLPLIIMFAALTACHKTTPAPEYVKGDVLAGIKGDVPIDSVFALFNRLGLQIKRVQSFAYSVPYPANKLDSIAAYLNTKPYIDTVNWKAQIAYNSRWQQTVYFSTFFNMTPANQADWLYTVNQLHLIDLRDTFSTAYLQVPEGSEQYWVDQLSKNSMIRWAQLNNIGHIQL